MSTEHSYNPSFFDRMIDESITNQSVQIRNLNIRLAKECFTFSRHSGCVRLITHVVRRSVINLLLMIFSIVRDSKNHYTLVIIFIHIGSLLILSCTYLIRALCCLSILSSFTYVTSSRVSHPCSYIY